MAGHQGPFPDGADPGVIGRPLTIDGVSHTIAGIMPRGFAFPDGGEALWMTLDEQSRTYPARDSGFLQIVGRLRPGVTIRQAQVAVAARALRATGVTALDSLRDAGRNAGGSLGRSRAQAALVVSEVALVFLLLTIAGLFIRSFDRLSHVDLGFDPERVLLVRVPTPAEFKQRDPRTLTFLEEVAARLSAVPGVAAVGAASEIPFEAYSTPPTSVETPPGVVQENIHSTVITPGYLRVMGMAVVAGRTLADSDREGSTPVALVSEAFVRRYWSAGNPLGRRIRIDVPMPPYSRWLTVVGRAGRAVCGRVQADPGCLPASDARRRSGGARAHESFCRRRSRDRAQPERQVAADPENVR